MKKILLTIFIFGFLLSAENIYSQPPGYMGKRFSIHADGLFFPSLRVYPHVEYYGIKSSANFNFSAVISEKKNFIAEYHCFKDFTVVYDYITGKEDVYYLRQKSFGMGSEFFTRGSIAPVGSYVKYNFLINYNSVDAYMDFPEPESFMSLKVGIGIGRKRIIADRIVINYGSTMYFNSSMVGAFVA